MFSFDWEIKGFKSIIERIEKNGKSGKLNNKEVKAYARCMLRILPELNINSRFKPEIQTLLAAISASSLPHYDRSFLVSRILELLEDDAFLKGSKNDSSIFSADDFERLISRTDSSAKISIVFDEEYFVDGGVAFSEGEAKTEVRNAIEKYFEENPDAKEKYSKNLEQLFNF